MDCHGFQSAERKVGKKVGERDVANAPNALYADSPGRAHAACCWVLLIGWRFPAINGRGTARRRTRRTREVIFGIWYDIIPRPGMYRRCPFPPPAGEWRMKRRLVLSLSVWRRSTVQPWENRRQKDTTIAGLRSPFVRGAVQHPCA